MTEGGTKVAMGKTVVRTPVSDAAAPKLRDLLGGRLGEVVLDTIRGVEAASNEKCGSASVNAAAALKAAGEAKALAVAAESRVSEAVSTAGSAQRAAAEALARAEQAASAVETLVFTEADGTEVHGAQAFTAMLGQLRRNTDLLSEQLAAAEGIRQAVDTAASSAKSAAAEAKAANARAEQAHADAESAKAETASAAEIVQAAAEQHSRELGRIEGMFTDLKKTVDGLSSTLDTLTKGLATIRVSLRLIAKHAGENGVIPENVATAIIEENSGGVG